MDRILQIHPNYKTYVVYSFLIKLCLVRKLNKCLLSLLKVCIYAIFCQLFVWNLFFIFCWFCYTYTCTEVWHFMLCLFTFFFLMIVLKSADDSMQNAFTGSRYTIRYKHLSMYSLWRKPLYNGSSCIYSDELKIKIDVRCKCRCKVVHVL